jgi:pyruvate kinase
VRAFYYKGFEGTDQTIQEVNQILLEKGLVQKGDIIINTASMPIQERGRTNTIKISEI